MSLCYYVLDNLGWANGRVADPKACLLHAQNLVRFNMTLDRAAVVLSNLDGADLKDCVIVWTVRRVEGELITQYWRNRPEHLVPRYNVTGLFFPEEARRNRRRAVR